MAVLSSISRRSGINRFALILAGGQGERFWPLSQPDFPKQFLPVFNNEPLINQTIARIERMFRKDQRLLIIPTELKGLTRQFVGDERFIIEPVRRNTAPAICLGAMTIRSEAPDAIIHVMPADHIIKPSAKFLRILSFAEKLAEQNYLVTYGIRPRHPETGYGYIHLDNEIATAKRIQAFNSKGFKEKPTLSRARYYLKMKTYLWNSGIFTFRAEDILAEIKNCIPDVYYGVQKYLLTGKEEYFAAVPDISIDYGVMEKSKRLCIVQGDFYWDDVGSWLAVERFFKKDSNKNIFIGNAKGLDTYNSIVYTNNIPVKTYGVKGLIIVASPKGVLVCKKDRAPDLKRLLKS